jgi:hypothetical protein
MSLQKAFKAVGSGFIVMYITVLCRCKTALKVALHKIIYKSLLMGNYARIVMLNSNKKYLLLLLNVLFHEMIVISRP